MLNLPDTIPADANTLNELGHIWYCDHVMGEFVEETEKAVPDSLFVITGDHGERFSFAKEMDLQTLASIPCIFYGKGIDPAWLPEKQFGSALQVAPTLAVLVGRKGDSYTSLVPDLLQKQDFVFNHRLWGDDTGMHEQSLQEPTPSVSGSSNADTVKTEPAPHQTKKSMTAANRKQIEQLRQITAWRILKGNQIK